MRNDFSSCKPTPAVDQSVRVDLQVGQETSRPVLNEHVTPGTLDPLAVVEDPVPTVPAIRLILNPQDGASSSSPARQTGRHGMLSPASSCGPRDGIGSAAGL
jgi:hypothetical protein